MKKCFAIMLLLLLTWPSVGQRIPIDLAKLSIRYNYHFYSDSNKTTGINTSKMVLQLGNDVSLFTQLVEILSDSLTYFFPNDPAYIHKLNDLLTIHGSHLYSSYRIYKNYPGKGESFFIKHFGSRSCYTVVDNEKPNWVLDNTADTVIMGYSCKRAFTSFRGRSYVAWYSPDIPISDGPYKFWGLPGLILLVHDSKNLHRFEISGIYENSSNTPILIVENLNKCREVSPKEFVEAFYAENMRYYNLVKEGKGIVQVDRKEQANLLKRIKAMNNFIEKF